MTTIDRSRPVTLSLSREAQWTLHHVLLDRTERDATTAPSTYADPLPVEVFQAFETLDGGETRFTAEQLEVVQTVLVEYHHSTTWWELERAQIERLLHQVTTHLDSHRTTPSTE